MSVSVYNNTDCKYRIPRLDKHVFILSSLGIGKINIDDGEAYIENLRIQPLHLKCYDVSISENEEFDERYAFTHTVSFSMLGYHSLDDIFQKYHIILKDIEGTYWVLNPEFPAKVTYTYTLDGNSSHTDFTVGTISNYPMLRVRDVDDIIPADNCVPYFIDGFKTLKLNETEYTRRKDTEILVTNSGFKDVVFSKDSAIFTEEFDGDNVSHTITFNIPLDSYRDSWHYNLLEFLNNTYSAIIGTKEGRNILCGFGLGLQPSYTISGGVNETDNIEITLSDRHSTGEFIGLTEVTVEDDDRRNYVWAPELGYECVGDGIARYLIQKEVDGFGNPTGKYRCLANYKQHFTDMGLNIIGTLTETATYPNAKCTVTSCVFQSTMPDAMTFNVDNCRTYSVMSDSDWTIVSDHMNVSVEPSNGRAGVAYDIEVCANSIDNQTHHLTVTYCDGLTKTYNVNLLQGNPCFTAGQSFDISANAQYVNIPVTCCTQSVSSRSSVIADINVSSTLIKVYVPQNGTGAMRSMVLDVKMCDGSTVEVTINQSAGFEKWVSEGSECNGSGQRCEIERKYTGTTAGLINTKTNETRYVNCVDDDVCGYSTRWLATDETYCDGGRKYIIEKEQYLDGDVWTDTGNYRLGNETADPSGECELPNEEWRNADGYICDGTTKYARERQYLNGVAQDVYRKSDTVIEEDSEDCGYIVGTDDWSCEKWEEVAGDYICDNGIKYNKEQRYVSDDCNTYTPTDVYRKGKAIEWASEDCGWKPEYSDYPYQEDRDEDGYICDGYDKWSVQRVWLSKDGVTWIRTDMTLMGTLIEKNSFDCGYIPTERCYDWRFEGYGCDGTAKYEILRKYISDDCNLRWYRTDILKYGNMIDGKSIECGYSDDYEYAWNAIEETICVGYDKYRLYQYQRRHSGSDVWTNVIPTQTSVDGNGTKTPILVEKDSYDCGYTGPKESIYGWMKDGTECDECGLTNYKEMWVSADGYICDGYDKYSKEVKKISLDGGNTYDVLLPEESRKGSLIESDSTDCGYVKFKFKATYSDGKTYELECNDSTRLTVIEVRPSDEYDHTEMVTADIGNCVKTIGQLVFQDFINLKSIDIPDGVTSIEGSAFNNCPSLTSIDIPNSVISIGNSVFQGCSGMTSVHIGNGVTTIGISAFRECSKLTYITIPDSVESIGNYAFYRCSGLTSVTVLPLTPPSLGTSNTFNNTNACTIYVHCDSLEAYKTADGWKEYADRIKPLSDKP